MSGRVVSRRTALAGGMAGAGALALGLPWPRAAGAVSRPNILVIETDDQAVESLRVMSNVQRLLIDRGTTFTHSYASFPLCAPSRSTLLTGQYAHNHGVLGNGGENGGFQVLDHSNSLPVWLQQAGYHTSLLGKYVNGYDPIGLADPSQIPPGWTDWNSRVSGDGYLNTRLNENGTLVSYEGQYQTDVYAEKAVDIVRRNAAGEQPFFIWVNFFAPHFGSPREADDPGTTGNGDTPAVADRHRDVFASEPLPGVPSFNEADVADKPRFIQNLPLLSAEDQADIRERYQQALESLLAVDEAIGRILSALEETGQADNTLVVFTSDNGFFNGEHRIPTRKREFYEPSARVPLILRGPGIPSGVSRDQVVANIDLAPTFVQAAQAEPGRAMDGRSLLPLARSPEIAQGRAILLEDEAVGSPVVQDAPRGAAVRTPRFLYAEYDYPDGGHDVELYDMREDPHQLDSRHHDPAYADARADLARLLRSLRSS
jgi:N-acetylglucosamine-6-sulfatase